MSHLSCYWNVPSNYPGIFVGSNNITILAMSGRDIPPRFDVYPWSLTCLSIPFKQITSIKVQILDCSFFNATFLSNFTNINTLDFEYLDQPISKTWLNSVNTLSSLTLRNLNGITHSSFLTDLCSSKTYPYLRAIEIDSLTNTLVPQCVFQNGWRALSSLSLTGMTNVKFASFTQLVQMNMLKNFNISSNNLNVIPDLLIAGYLETLDISNNAFKTLDNNDFPNLISLYASNNSFSQIPYWFYYGSQNNYLDMSFNPLIEYVASDIFSKAIVNLSGNSGLVQFGTVDCTYTVRSLIMDNLIVDSIAAMVGCSSNLRFRNLQLKDVSNLRSLLVGKSIDISFSPSYYSILQELCMDAGVQKTITIHKNITLPSNCVTNINSKHTVMVDYTKCGYLNNLKNLTVGIWSLTCIEPTYATVQKCLKFYSASSTIRSSLTISEWLYSKIFSTLSFSTTALRISTQSKLAFKWYQVKTANNTIPHLGSSSEALYYNYSTKYNNYSTIFYNYSGNISNTIFPKYGFQIKEESSAVNGQKKSSEYLVTSVTSTGTLLSTLAPSYTMSTLLSKVYSPAVSQQSSNNINFNVSTPLNM